MTQFYDIYTTTKPTEKISYEDPYGIVAWVQLGAGVFHLLLTAEQWQVRQKDDKKQSIGIDCVGLSAGARSTGSKLVDGARIPKHVFNATHSFVDGKERVAVSPTGARVSLDAKAEPVELWEPVPEPEPIKIEPEPDPIDWLGEVGR